MKVVAQPFFGYTPGRRVEAYPLIDMSTYTVDRDDSFAHVRLEDGLPVITYKASGRSTVSPTMVAIVGLVAHGRGDGDGVVRCVDWLEQNAVARGAAAVWPFDLPFVAHGHRLEAGWTSMLTQGMVLSLLLRADRRDLAARAAAFFEVPMPEGLTLEDGWFEEYPGSARVLNGHLFALFGLHEAVAAGLGLRTVLDRGQAAARHRLADFELRLPGLRWTRYDDGCAWYAGESYHDLHVRQLRVLGRALEDPLLLQTADRWGAWQERYGRHGPRLLVHKAAYALQALRIRLRLCRRSSKR